MADPIEDSSSRMVLWPGDDETLRSAMIRMKDALLIQDDELDFYRHCEFLAPEQWICFMFGLSPMHGMAWAELKLRSKHSKQNRRLNEALALLGPSPMRVNGEGRASRKDALQWAAVTLTEFAQEGLDANVMAILSNPGKAPPRKDERSSPERELHTKTENNLHKLVWALVVYIHQVDNTGLSKHARTPFLQDLAAKLSEYVRPYENGTGEKTLIKVFNDATQRLAEKKPKPAVWGKLPPDFLKLALAPPQDE